MQVAIPIEAVNGHGQCGQEPDHQHTVGMMMTEMFPPELVRDAFRADNGEFGWTRAQIPLVVDVLRSQGMGILGGDLWWVRVESTRWDGLIPQRHGPPAVCMWAVERLPSESWPDFVERGAPDALAHVERWPNALDLPPGLEGQILCSLTWVSDLEYDRLTRKAV